VTEPAPKPYAGVWAGRHTPGAHPEPDDAWISDKLEVPGKRSSHEHKPTLTTCLVIGGRCVGEDG